MLKLAQERSRKRRRKILLAATRVFGERGVHAATLAEICKRAGVSRSVLYDYFADKTALLSAVPQANFEEFYGEIDRVLARTHGTWSRLSAFYLGTLSYIERNPAWGRVFFLEIWPSVLGAERPVRAAVDIYARRYVNLLKDGIKRGELARRNDPYLLASLVLGSMTHLVATWLLYRRPADLRRQGKRALDLLEGLVIFRTARVPRAHRISKPKAR